MKQCQKRGVVDPVSLVVVCVLLFTGVISVDKFKNLLHSDSKQKTEAVVVTNDAGAAQAAAKKAADEQSQKDAAAKARYDSIHEEIRVAKTALDSQPAPTPAVALADVFVTKADAGFDVLPASQAEEAITIFTQLSAQNAADRAAGQAKADALQAKLDAAKASEAALAVQLEQSKASASSLLDKTVADGRSLAKWGAENETLVQRLESFVIWASIAAALFFIIFHLLPIAAKFFPVLAPIAKGVSAIVAFPLHALHSAETEYHKLAASAATAKAEATQVALSAEKAAHAATAATLVKVALTPDLPANTITTP